MPKIPTIKGSKFILRKLNPEKDKESIWKNLNNPEVMKWLSFDYPYTEDNWNWYVNHINEIEEGRDVSLNWIIEFKGKAIGAISLSLSRKNSAKHLGKFGYYIGQDYWGQGIVTEAVKLVCDYAFNKLGLLKLQIGYREDNKGSARVAEKNGFKFEAKMIKETFKENKYHNLIYTYKIKKGVGEM